MDMPASNKPSASSNASNASPYDARRRSEIPHPLSHPQQASSWSNPSTPPGDICLQPVKLGIHAAQQRQGMVGRLGHDLVLRLAHPQVEKRHAARSYPTAMSTKSLMMSWIS